MRRLFATTCLAVALLGATAVAPARADETRRTTLQVAAIHGLTHTDAGNHVMLQQGSLRLRVYPDTATVLVAGKQFTVKDRFVREGGQVMITPRVQRFLARQIATARAAEQQRLARVAPRPSSPAPALEPLPPRLIPAKKIGPQRRRVLPAATVPAQPDVQPSAGWVPQGVRERPWKWIVIHHSDDRHGNLSKYDRVHRECNGWENGCGYHFVVGNGSQSGDGEIEVGPRWRAQLQGAHAKVPGNRYNERGIGICLVGDFDEGGRRPTPAQMEELVRLIRWLRARYDIELADIQGHGEVCATQCPGRYFPWDELRQRIR